MPAPSPPFPLSQRARGYGSSLREFHVKAELAELLFEKVGLNKHEAKDMVEASFEEMRVRLEKSEEVKQRDDLAPILAGESRCLRAIVHLVIKEVAAKLKQR